MVVSFYHSLHILDPETLLDAATTRNDSATPLFASRISIRRIPAGDIYISPTADGGKTEHAVSVSIIARRSLFLSPFVPCVRACVRNVNAPDKHKKSFPTRARAGPHGVLRSRKRRH